MKLRPVLKSELPACVRLIRESFLTVAAQFAITPENAPRFTAYAISEERLAWQFDRGRVMIGAFSEAGSIIGYYALDVAADGTLCALCNLCVAPAHRHRGIGAALLTHAFSEAAARGCRNMTLGYVYENTVLGDWYASFGFVHTGVKKLDFFPFTCGYMEKEL